jgi:hypothetical protein
LPFLHGQPVTPWRWTTALTVQPINEDLQAGKAVNGIPFRPPQSYVARLYTFDPAKQQYVQATSAGDISVTTQDEDRLYVLGFNGQPLSNSNVAVTFNPNSTLASVSASSTSQGQAALTALGTQASGVAQAFRASAVTAQANATAYAAALVAYYTAESAYCAASKATPLDLGAVRIAAANVYASEVTLASAHSTSDAKTPLPFATLIDPSKDVGVGCPS